MKKAKLAKLVLVSIILVMGLIGALRLMMIPRVSPLFQAVIGVLGVIATGNCTFVFIRLLRKGD